MLCCTHVLSTCLSPPASSASPKPAFQNASLRLRSPNFKQLGKEDFGVSRKKKPFYKRYMDEMLLLWSFSFLFCSFLCLSLEFYGLFSGTEAKGEGQAKGIILSCNPEYIGHWPFSIQLASKLTRAAVKGHRERTRPTSKPSSPLLHQLPKDKQGLHSPPSPIVAGLVYLVSS